MIVFSIAPAILSAPALTLMGVALVAICAVLLLWWAAEPARPEIGVSDDLTEVLQRLEETDGADGDHRQALSGPTAEVGRQGRDGDAWPAAGTVLQHEDRPRIDSARSR